MNGDYDQLRDAGLIADTQLPGQLQPGDRGPGQTRKSDVLVPLKQRLDDAHVATEPLSREPRVRVESIVIASSAEAQI